ncbi:hypothetical protein EJ08DRAFT_699249 [Tothia fuscella]|uniref:Uncharacterized protein n=1 Tax=Tothia fuscella TaxID=1048955 RepID=A0A9P4NN84_9PEZI|nr:hypothetical protein EJ08DRAFT_699249 [Tothia fuscella]
MMASRVVSTRRPLPPAAGDLSITRLPVRKTRSQQVKKKSYQSPILPPSARPTNSKNIQLSESDAFRFHDEFTASTIYDASSPELWDKFLALNIQFEKYLEAWHKEAKKGAMNEHWWRTERDKFIVQYGEAKVISATDLEDYIFKRRTAIMMKINEVIDARRMFRLDPPKWKCYDPKSSVDGRVRYYNEEDEHFHWSPAREKSHIKRVNPQTILGKTSLKHVQADMRPWINSVVSDPDLKLDRHDEDIDWVLEAGSWEGQYLRARTRTWENLKRKFADRMLQGRSRQVQAMDNYADRHKKALKKMRSEAEVDDDGPKFLRTSQS